MHGKVLRIVRIANNLSIKDFAKQANLSANFISELENERKNPTLTTFEK